MKLSIEQIMVVAAFALSGCQSSRWICGTCAGYGQERRPLTLVESVSTTHDATFAAFPIASFPMPQHPWELVRAGIAGTVDVQITVEANGRVRSAEIIKSSMKEFEAPTLSAVESWRFLVFRRSDEKSVDATTVAYRIQFGFDES